MRFNHNCTTHKEIYEYYYNCAIKFAHDGLKLVKLETIKEGVWATFTYKGEYYYSLYLLTQYRGLKRYKNLYLERFNDYSGEIITSQDCQLENYLNKSGIPYKVIIGLTQTPEYLLIDKIYSNTKAERSGIYYMNHIDEGLYYLYLLNSRRKAKLGYILHPIFQNDNDLLNNITLNDINYLDNKAVILAMEYRNLANSYLSYMSFKQINLSVLESVNQMLIADKIQNYKDFNLYNKSIEKDKTKKLNEYFMNWFNLLNIDTDMYNQYIEYFVELKTLCQI